MLSLPDASPSIRAIKNLRSSDVFFMCCSFVGCYSATTLRDIAKPCKNYFHITFARARLSPGYPRKPLNGKAKSAITP
jgi:hypothetical protein